MSDSFDATNYLLDDSNINLILKGIDKCRYLKCQTMRCHYFRFGRKSSCIVFSVITGLCGIANGILQNIGKIFLSSISLLFPTTTRFSSPGQSTSNVMSLHVRFFNIPRKLCQRGSSSI